MTLDELLLARSSGKRPLPQWQEADRALLARDYDRAVRLYSEQVNPGPQDHAKHGFCLGMLGKDEAAEELLNEDNVGSHPEALAILAWVIAGSDGQRLRGGFGSKDAMERSKVRKDRVMALLRSAIAPKSPPKVAFSALFHIVGSHDHWTLEQAARAKVLFPDWSWPHAIIATRRRLDDVVELQALTDMMGTIANAIHSDVFHEAYVHAMLLQRWEDVGRVIDAIEDIVKADEQKGDANLAVIAEMRAMQLLHQGRAGQSEAYAAIDAQLREFMPNVPHVANGRDPVTAPKFALQAALEIGDVARVRSAATEIVTRSWARHGGGTVDLDSWAPFVTSSKIHGVLHFGHFGFDLTRRWREIEAVLDGEMKNRWRLLVAADDLCFKEPESESVNILCETEIEELPWWIGVAIFRAHELYSENYEKAGAALAELAERAGPGESVGQSMTPGLLESLYLDVEDHADPIALFSGALGWLRENPEANGVSLLSEWGYDLAEIDGGKPLLSQLTELSLSRLDSAVAKQLKIMADVPETQESNLEKVLAKYPHPDETRVYPQDLGLAEAATLIALLRVGEIDHVRWTVSPLDRSPAPFEPTKKFVGTLFQLMEKGVIAIDPSTPCGVAGVHEDGRLWVYLRQVVWRISPSTLALYRDIRNLEVARWPQAWRDHAAVLSRDLGVEELVVYMERLLTGRDLPLPNTDELRLIFRDQLESLSMAQCYYLAHKTIREALDYKAHRRPGRAQLQTRVINLLRGNGEKAVAQGWDTRYRRDKELPASLMWEALHDVLTRWGAAAFDVPLMTLSLDDNGVIGK